MGGGGGVGGIGGMAGMGGMGGMGGGIPVICQPGSMAACYTGPAGTMGVGLCVGGTWTCNAEGTAYGPCTGEVLPVAEDCTAPADENCNGAGPDCGASVWSKRFGDLDGQSGKTIVTDAMGNVYVAGNFYGSIDFGAGPLAAAFLDGFLVKFDPMGKVLWAKQFTDPGSSSAQTLAIDSAGNVVVGGAFQGPTDFGGGPLVATEVDIFVAKYDPSGKHIWSKRFGGANTQSVSTIAIDAQDNILLGGAFAGTLDFGGGALSAASYDFFVAKLDTNGNHVWSKKYDHPNGNQPELQKLAVDSAGNVVFTGYFFGTVNFGGTPLTSTNSYDLYLVKLDPSGQHVWSKRYGGALGQSAYGLVVDTMGNIVLGGSFDGSIDLGGGNFTSAGNDDFFLAKFSPTGNHIWSKRYGDAQQQYITDLAIGKNGELALAITMNGTLDFGGGALLTSAGGVDVATARFDAAGNHIWSKRAGDATNQSSYGIAFDPTGHVLITGNLVGNADFGNGVLTSAGSSDLYVAKLAP